MSAEEFLADIRDNLELERESIRMDDCFREYEEWDSLTFLALMTLMRQEYDVQIDIDTFNNLHTWQDLFDMIKH